MATDAVKLEGNMSNKLQVHALLLDDMLTIS